MDAPRPQMKRHRGFSQGLYGSIHLIVGGVACNEYSIHTYAFHFYYHLALFNMCQGSRMPYPVVVGDRLQRQPITRVAIVTGLESQRSKQCTLAPS
ncbi:hypothetical protein M441DRAFT_73001 [Trichoderma asperellum CBS 433.97]|uniref:Uncharacterized protein n=1 Tax=Trichoderma asperellum (strain ATCC 204424 / CBS 433.97 / NBRC 101777) TaxID=1042311 RepID=A0A2T3YWM4_TRIA4|nr:hypothetical protein M441DRAFT_73001 [Trichoderma asperellum CBS 433.97]PTB36937.1 hypothetical protein M441DRAFT_73001 [Trichoderma asperellum CBS 433.97]